VVGLAAFQTTLAQVPNVTQPPPAIAFDAWREVVRTDEAVEYAVSFPSALTSRFEVNNTVPLRVLVPADAKGPVPVVLIMHYWGATDLRAEISLATDMARKGVASAILTLPYHLGRTPPGVRSGQLAIEPDPARLSFTMAQSVLDARRALDFLATRPEFRSDQIGLAGTSLGAIVAVLTFAVEPRITHAAFLLGGADIANVLWTSSRVVPQREILRRRGFTESRLRKELEAVEPLRYLPARRTGSTFVIGAKYDTVVPPESTDRLIQNLPNVKTLLIDTGHYGGIFVQRRLLREIGNFFTTEFSGQPFVPPKRVYAPTVRLGVKYDVPSGLDVGGSIDLLRFDRRGDGFASLFLSPRGPQIFVGRKLTQGLSFGASVGLNRSGVGLFWSSVL